MALSPSRIVVVLTLLFLGLPGSAVAKKRPAEPVVAVWNLADIEHDGAEAAAWRQRITRAISELPTVDADASRRFPPEIRRAEGVDLRLTLATRRMEAAWRAYAGREWAAARSLLDEATAQLAGLPGRRLPPAFRRDVEILRARVQVGQGDTEGARESFARALEADPAWRPRYEAELPAFLRAAEDALAEAAKKPRVAVSLESAVPGVRLLVEGVDRGTLAGMGRVELPPGAWELCGRKLGFADECQTVHLAPGIPATLRFEPRVENSLGFQAELGAALDAPRSQRGAGVWEALKLAAASIEARAVLAIRFDADEGAPRGGRLLLGLYMPGRQGWAFYRALDLHSDLGRDQLLVEATIEELLVTVTTQGHQLATLWP
jgi:hypothetical protein